ncbi:proteasome subunit alpha type, putative [Ichthyophthirius multifiliis]|uniref:Proteasome subunit alpha type, putative n=1 Tax=Ichthyophthirius multifiliis TaxID=5932 RepID=G0QRF0_ICHMU|nr:proteasome subunit alpha type, putative [Ichthyophthirius multifiliis]EGR32205.1 proteasome subunit alpha type, putative [Ichthyophthirius multifiliis]|eukprot:XP_004035691.1 proteasome subunit alpha type, putative [Ichthyophthirius multifiliis]
MNINYYDTDCSTWHPTGKLFQVEYATKAIDFGSICLGLRSNTHAVLVSQKRSAGELAGYQEKVFQISDQMGMSIAGITADARILCKYMRNECLNYKYTYGSAHPVKRLIAKVAEKSQNKTQVYGKRPYGVGMLIIAHDQDGPHLIQTLPSGEYYEYYAYSIGARSQSAKTQFENHVNKLAASTLEQLILHGLYALKKAVQDDEDINQKSVDIAFVGNNSNFTELKPNQVNEYLEKLKNFKPEDQMDIQN